MLPCPSQLIILAVYDSVSTGNIENPGYEQAVCIYDKDFPSRVYVKYFHSSFVTPVFEPEVVVLAQCFVAPPTPLSWGEGKLIKILDLL